MKGLVQEKKKTTKKQGKIAHADHILPNDIYVVIPAYNEERTIRELVLDLLNYCTNIIVVDDASKDRTCALLKDLPIILIQNQENSGKAITLHNGFDIAIQKGARAIITMDGDGQHRPSDIPRFMEEFVREPNSIIIGSRLHNKEDIPPARYFGNTVANFWISWAAGNIITDSQSGFRLYPVSLFQKTKTKLNKRKGFVFESEILIDASHKGVFTKAIPIDAIYHEQARPSHFKGFTDVMRIIRMVAIKLLKRGMNPPGLFRVLKFKMQKRKGGMVGADGFFTLTLSLLLIFITGGLIYLYNFAKVFHTARSTPAFLELQNSLILVPGFRLEEGGHLHPDFVQRLERALVLANQDSKAKVMILGGKTSKSTLTEAEAGKEYLIFHGLGEKRIIMEDRSRHTLENFQNARTIISQFKIQDVVLITNRYHLERASVFSKSFGIQHRICAAEENLPFDSRTLVTILKEAFLLYWFHTGKFYATATKNSAMLSRIS